MFSASSIHASVALVKPLSARWLRNKPRNEKLLPLAGTRMVFLSWRNESPSSRRSISSAIS